MKTYSNLQEVYDTAVAGLSSQEFKPSYGGRNGTSCAYRGGNGRKCAIGWCIPDELYSPEMEGKTVYSMFAEHWKAMREIFPISISVGALRELQNCHDIAVVYPGSMRGNLRAFGLKYRLQIPDSLQD